MVAGLACDSADPLDMSDQLVQVEDTEQYFSVLADSTDYIWQNENMFTSSDLEEYTRASLISFLNPEAFGGHDGCKFFVGEMEHLADGEVRVSGLIEYEPCPGGISLEPDTFRVYSGDRRIEFRSETGGFTLRSNYVKSLEDAGLTGKWARERVEHEATGQLVSSSFFNLEFRADRRFNSEGSCLNGHATCTRKGGAFFGISEDRFITYHFDSELSRQRVPEVDYDFLYSSYYRVAGDTLLIWGSPMGHRHVFARGE